MRLLVGVDEQEFNNTIEGICLFYEFKECGFVVDENNFDHDYINVSTTIAAVVGDIPYIMHMDDYPLKYILEYELRKYDGNVGIGSAYVSHKDIIGWYELTDDKDLDEVLKVVNRIKNALFSSDYALGKIGLEWRESKCI